MGQNLSIDFAEAKQAFGSSSDAFIEGFVLQLVNAVSPDEKAMALAASIVSGIRPNDQIEAMLGAQMAAVHDATMTFARRLAHVETIQQQDSAERAFNKLARTSLRRSRPEAVPHRRSAAGRGETRLCP